MNDSKIVGITGPRKPPNAGVGRKKGTPNKVTADVREMVLGALAQAGGQQWLAKQANENPTAFMALLGKLLPKQVDLDASITTAGPVTEIRRTIVDPGERHDDR